ncbi:hypothetical protein P152DRAFT_9220 [Eremomyces bilateralis CBS 781.70]|uniref:Uncharacterized protein n=1 Tax=Eremomyces bilateralis CBS 781.70 TaxID=1392243 RepID=A0A6G1GGL0_9PEZI|nr:uncharacterized protein P152DRAFT_9220 [Eremomyces bilateralis CBS 781.70]KAF1817132.1 hypothetical protein P152DRAFT_9220 [Eremomyces bilateralis CBS 781.70]
MIDDASSHPNQTSPRFLRRPDTLHDLLHASSQRHGYNRTQTKSAEPLSSHQFQFVEETADIIRQISASPDRLDASESIRSAPASFSVPGPDVVVPSIELGHPADSADDAPRSPFTEWGNATHGNGHDPMVHPDKTSGRPPPPMTSGQTIRLVQTRKALARAAQLARVRVNRTRNLPYHDPNNRPLHPAPDNGWTPYGGPAPYDGSTHYDAPITHQPPLHNIFLPMHNNPSNPHPSTLPHYSVPIPNPTAHNTYLVSDPFQPQFPPSHISPNPAPPPEVMHRPVALPPPPVFYSPIGLHESLVVHPPPNLNAPPVVHPPPSLDVPVNGPQPRGLQPHGAPGLPEQAGLAVGVQGDGTIDHGVRTD